MDNVGKLEECVRSSCTFTGFFSQGYAASYNCQREIYAAFDANKPIITIFDPEKQRGGASIEIHQQDVLKHLTRNGDQEAIYQWIFCNHPPIPWVRRAPPPLPRAIISRSGGSP